MALLSRAREIAGLMYDDGCCPYCLLDLAKGFSKDADALDEARKDVRTLWGDCARALSFAEMDPGYMADSSEEMRAKAQNSLDSCPQHSETPPSDDILHDFMGGVCACLHICLSRGETSAVQRAAKHKRAYGNHGGYWPVDRTDLFPYGEQPGVQSVLFWCSKLKSPWALHLLADALRIAHPLVFYELMEAEGNLYRDLMLGVMRRFADFAKWMVRPDEEDAAPPTPNPTANMRAALSLLLSVRDSPDALPSSLLIFADGLEPQLFQVLQLALRTVDRSEPVWGTLARLCATLYHQVPTPDPETMLCPEILPYTRAHETLSAFGVLYRALKTMARNRRICSGPDCATAAHQEPGEHFMVCGRCRLPRYCAKTCQTADWKRGAHVAHKVVCPLIRKLLATATLEMTRAEFENSAKSLQWDRDELRALVLFTMNIRLLSVEVLLRAATLYRELLGDDEVSDRAADALEYADRMGRMVVAKKAGLPVAND